MADHGDFAVYECPLFSGNGRRTDVAPNPACSQELHLVAVDVAPHGPSNHDVVGIDIRRNLARFANQDVAFNLQFALKCAIQPDIGLAF